LEAAQYNGSTNVIDEDYDKATAACPRSTQHWPLGRLQEGTRIGFRRPLLQHQEGNGGCVGQCLVQELAR
jgi:hypothetical protein